MNWGSIQRRANKQRRYSKALAITVGLAAVGVSMTYADGWDPSSKAGNMNSIVDTRHNLTMRYPGNDISGAMNTARNDYGEVCVYCHTPHGANRTIDAPLWNRTNRNTNYTLYNKPLTSGQAPTAPGVNSLVCLSCHDGTVAIDSIINMPSRPGFNSYEPGQETDQVAGFLESWPDTDPAQHARLGDCMFCHTDGNPFGIPDFAPFLIGTDLSDDHPVGVSYPDPQVYDFKAPTGATTNMQFFDTNNNGRADDNELRLFNSGDGFEVECASCHNPHGTPISGTSGPLAPSFMRVSEQSVLCLTCHDK